MTLQHQSHLLPSVQIHIPPSNPLFFSLPSNLHEFMTQPVPYAFSDITDQQPSRAGMTNDIENLDFISYF
jgi:hypothetical protein